MNNSAARRLRQFTAECDWRPLAPLTRIRTAALATSAYVYTVVSRRLFLDTSHIYHRKKTAVAGSALLPCLHSSFFMPAGSSAIE